MLILIRMASLKMFFGRIFGTVLMIYLNDSFTAHSKLPFVLARCILLTGLSLIPACTSPLIRALRFDSTDWQLQWRDTGGTVSQEENKFFFMATLIYTNKQHNIVFQPCIVSNMLSTENNILNKLLCIFNRPGDAGAVLQTALSVIT